MSATPRPATAVRTASSLALALALALALVAAPVAGATAAAAPSAASDPGGADLGDVPAAANESEARRSSSSPASSASSADAPVIDHTYELARTPAKPDSVRVRSVVDVPTNVVNVTLALPAGSSVQRLDGFSRLGPRRIAWDDDAATRRPTVVYTVPANRSDGFGRIGVETGSYAFVDTDGVRTGASWAFRPPAPRYEVSVTTAGEGTATGAFAYMGPYATRSYDGSQRFRYVRTGAASTAIPPEKLMRGLSEVGKSLAVGERDETVVLFAAPDTLRTGGRAGDASLWVNVAGSAGDDWAVWYHEYVHTRQNISADEPSIYWLIEASADYYGGYYAWQRDRMSDDRFREYLATDEHADARLIDAVRGGDDREYTKGRRVIAALDLEIRRETGGNRTFVDVLDRVNRRPVDYPTFKSIVRRVADDTDGSLGTWLDRYVTTEKAPPIPSDVAAAYGAEDTDPDPGNGNGTDGPARLPGGTAAPTDPDGDGRYEDIDGDGTFDVFDVQLFLEEFGAPAVQEDAARFDFDGSGDGSVDIFDVQALLEEL